MTLVEGHTRYDPAVRRRAVRRGRERGCWVYIALDELRKAGIDPDAPPPLYKAWGSPGGGAFLRFYQDGDS